MIEIKNLTVEYSDKTVALEGIDISIGDEKCVGVIGANGAGKSTLLSSVLGLVPVKSGSIIVNGTELCKNTLTEIRKSVGMVFQNPDDQLFMPTVYENIVFGAKNYGIADADKRAEKLLFEFGIDKLKDKLTHRLSWGEKRRVSIASAMMLNPEIIIMDEPTSFLDPKAKRNFVDMLGKIECQKIIATHNLEIAKEVCDRIIILKDGKKAADGEPSKLLSDLDLLKSCNLY